MTSPEPIEERVCLVEADLLTSGVVEVLDFSDPAQRTAWEACDIASMVDGCFHERVDPWALRPSERERWLERLADSYILPGFAADAWLTRYYWLLDPGRRGRRARIGTLALPRTTSGAQQLRLWSLYVHPDERRRGLATEALRACYRAAAAAGLSGITLDTHWPWQRSLGFYLARRMWVTSWKNSIGLSWRRTLPAWDLVEEEPDAVRFVVHHERRWRPLYRARRKPRRLELLEEPLARRLVGDGQASPIRLYGHATLAVALAMRGWPLVRSPDAWASRHGSTDIGQVEGLAEKIRRFEEVARAWGWDLRTPSIPLPR